MAHITFTDNNSPSPPSLADLLPQDVRCQIHAYKDLQSVAGKSLQELCRQNERLLVFPHSLADHDKGLEGQFIVQLEGSPQIDNEGTIVCCGDIKVKTGNLMGFVGFSGKGNHHTKLEIRSRFTESHGQDYFLHYMLEKVFRVNLFDLQYSHRRDEGLDLLALLFPHLLKKALCQGVFRSYQTYEKNDAAIRGPVNVSRHIRENSPFGGKIAYRSREHTADNKVTQLIRHTIEFLRGKRIGQAALSCDQDTKKAVGQIVEATDTSYSVQSRQSIIFGNLKPTVHPYYSDYRYLQQLCLLILRNQTMAYSRSNSPLYGILFDGAWLWEEYLAAILCGSKLGERQFMHPTNKNRRGGIRLFDNSQDDAGEIAFSKCHRRIYPDFYRENSAHGPRDGMILDAKYKRLEQGLVRDDLYQVISYMHTMRVNRGGFVYPLQRPLGKEAVESRAFKLANGTGIVLALGLSIPQNGAGYREFAQGMAAAEGELCRLVQSAPMATTAVL